MCVCVCVCVCYGDAPWILSGLLGLNRGPIPSWSAALSVTLICWLSTSGKTQTGRPGVHVNWCVWKGKDPTFSLGSAPEPVLHETVWRNHTAFSILHLYMQYAYITIASWVMISGNFIHFIEIILLIFWLNVQPCWEHSPSLCAATCTCFNSSINSSEV